MDDDENVGHGDDGFDMDDTDDEMEGMHMDEEGPESEEEDSYDPDSRFT